MTVFADRRGDGRAMMRPKRHKELAPVLSGERDKECGALAFSTVKGDVAVVIPHDFACKGKTYTVAALVAVDDIGGAIEQREEVFLRLTGNADAGIAHRNDGIVLVLQQFDDDFPAVTVVFYGV